MTRIEVALDPTNPGQALACHGLLEFSDLLEEGMSGRYVVDSKAPRRAMFLVEGPGDVTLVYLLHEVETTRAEALPHNYEKIAPVRLSGAWGDLLLRWWLDPTGTDASPLKLWAGQQRSVHPFSAIAEKIGSVAGAAGDRPFDVWLPLRSRFGFDPRSSWNQLDVGYSPNLQDQEVRTFPVVEWFSAVALEWLGPWLWTEKGRLSTLRYRLFEESLPPPAARAAFADALAGAGGEAYEARLDPRGSFSAFKPAMRVRTRESGLRREVGT